MPDNKEDKIPEEFKKEDNGIYSKEDREKARDDVKSLLSKLEDGLKAVFDSDNYKNYLNTMSKFHNYLLNTRLINVAVIINCSENLIIFLKNFE